MSPVPTVSRAGAGAAMPMTNATQALIANIFMFSIDQARISFGSFSVGNSIRNNRADRGGKRHRRTRWLVFPAQTRRSEFQSALPVSSGKNTVVHGEPEPADISLFWLSVQAASVFRFVMEYEHVDFPQPCVSSPARAGITIVEDAGAADEDRQYETRRKLLKLHAEAAEWFHENLTKREIGEPARKYLKQRGIREKSRSAGSLATRRMNGTAFGSWARGQGYDTRDLVASGLVKTKDDDQTTNPQSSNFV
jgi:DNA primase